VSGSSKTASESRRPCFAGAGRYFEPATTRMKEQTNAMKPAKHWYFVFLVLMSLSLAACTRNLSGFNGSNGGGGNNGGGGTGGTGGGGNNNASTFTIGGKVSGLLGIGMVLEDNGGDDLTVAGNGAFTFKTAVNGAYSVTVKTQPTSPVQLCTVTNASGTATANITTVQVNCGGGGLTVGGSVSGLIGSGLVLQDNGGDNFIVTGNGNVTFTFASSLNAGATYAVTVLTQPANPTQTCTVVNGTGTISSSVNNVEVICTQPGFTIGGSVVGLVVGAGDTLELQDNAGDDLFVTGDTTFKFGTPITNGGIYNVSMFLPPKSQPQPCNEFFYTGIATANVSNVLVDCQHNDWNWITWYLASTNGANNYAAITTPLIPRNAVPPADVGTPGGRDFAAAWTDNFGRKWLFGGNGFPYPSPLGKQLPGFLNDLWVFDQGEGWIPANMRTYVDPAGDTLVDPTQLEFTDVGTGGSPGSRWGSSSWTDTSGNLWLFGGQGFGSLLIDPVLLNDLWRCTPNAASIDAAGAGTSSCPWNLVGGSTVGNTTGNYPGAVGNTGVPGGRWGAATATDASGNFWLFGGQGIDSAGTTGLLNDLWMYSTGSNTWTWMGPSISNIANQNGNYPATPGLTSGTATTAPGGRQAAVLWVDSSKNVWLFGGFGFDSKGTNGPPGPSGPAGAILNDLWEFNFATKQWNWISGSNVANQTGTYGTQQVANQAVYPPGFVPGSRWGAVGWKDSNNNLWFFGGWGYGSVATNPTGFLNDVWEYQASSGNWVWWKGDSSVNQNGQYLTQGIPFVNNIAGARRGAALWQQDPNGYVWMFGGEGYDSSQGNPPGYLNDLWTYLPFP